MLNVLLARLEQKHRTARYPVETPTLPDRFQGAPVIDPGKCTAGCTSCLDVCPTDALSIGTASPDPVVPPGGGLALDMGRCLFCAECTAACPAGAVTFSQDHRLSVRTREALIVREHFEARAEALDAKMKSLFGRSLKLRQVSAGGCNACEADINVLSTVVFDLGRFGIQIVASPRHADGLIITGPVSENMRVALKKTYDATPAPKIVVAVGACAISGGPFVGHPEVHGGADSVVPVDLYIPGCPPHPYTILDGLLRLLGKIEDGTRKTP